jgi:hypothetical protein
MQSDSHPAQGVDDAADGTGEHGVRRFKAAGRVAQAPHDRAMLDRLGIERSAGCFASGNRFFQICHDLPHHGQRLGVKVVRGRQLAMQLSQRRPQFLDIFSHSAKIGLTALFGKTPTT